MSYKDADLTVKTHVPNQDLSYEPSPKRRWTNWKVGRGIVLIHGFMTDEASASRNYTVMRYHLRKIDRNLAKQVRTFSWPADPKIKSHKRYFLDTDELARRSGRLLATYIHDDLKDRSLAGRDYVFVGHSLGCRVILEMLKALYEKGADYGRRMKCVLMAPAVATDDLKAETGYNYLDSLDALVDRHLLYSPHDRTLRYIFPVGSLSPGIEAIGLEGNPRMAWRDRASAMLGYRHTDYWKDDDHQTSRAIANFLGVPIIIPMASDPAVSSALLTSETMQQSIL